MGIYSACFFGFNVSVSLSIDISEDALAVLEEKHKIDKEGVRHLKDYCDTIVFRVFYYVANTTSGEWRSVIGVARSTF